MDGIAVFLFYAIVGTAWAFVKITTPKERQSALEWSIIAILMFGSAGFLYGLIK